MDNYVENVVDYSQNYLCLVRYRDIHRVIHGFLERFPPFFAEKYEGQMTVEELSDRLLVHEYGHTVQSLLLGPLYLIVIGIPSVLWGFLGSKKRRDDQIPYGAFFTERWANSLGEWVTGNQSIGNLVLD